ncbi:hypothetical protein OIV83_006116 [Microbotryomycetes sp. JL201]|nr:hypothetical protein OIV83_006116 [Microbotryomycetes sp. JL201]
MDVGTADPPGPTHQTITTTVRASTSTSSSHGEDKAAPVRPFKCTQCDQAYARAEHLDRHARTHIPNSKFPCDQCGREFARTDVLKRHKKLHERDGSSTPGDLRNIRKQAALDRSARVATDADTVTYDMSLSDAYTGGSHAADLAESLRTASSTYSNSGQHHDELPPLPHVPTPSSAIVSLPPAQSDQYAFDQLLDFVAYAPEPAHVETGATIQSMADMSNMLSLPANQVVPSQQAHSTSLPTFDLFGGFLAVSPPNLAVTSPAFDPGLQLPNDDSLFWSSFVSPPGSFQGGVDMTSPDAKGRAPRRGKIDTTAGGLATRHASPAAEEEGERNRQWPMVWNPSERDSEIHLEPSTAHDLETNGSVAPVMLNLPKMDEETRLAVLETLRFARLSDHEYHALYRSLSKIKLQTYDTLVGLYFRHFHPNMPMLHVPTFNPRTTPGYLLLEIIGVGALHAPFPGSLQLGRVLLELGRRVIEELTTKDNRHARMLPMAQTMLIWGMMRYIGSPRSLELAEVFQGVCVATLRRLKVFDEPIPVSPTNAPLQERWHSYIKHEERRRTGMVCFLLESEFSTLLHHPSLLQASDLNTCLPSPEELWNAKDAESWNLLTPTLSPPLKVGAICKVITLDSPFPIPQSIRLTPFGAHVLVRSLHLNVFNAAQFSSTGMANIADSARLTVRRALGRVGRGDHEYSPTFGSNQGEGEFSAARVSYHLAHIETHINGAELDTLAGLGTLAEVTAARSRLTSWMSSNTESARSIALHAGQLVRIIRSYPTYGTYEPCSLFYASLCLYVYSRSLTSTGHTPATESSAAPEPFMLDGTLTDVDCATWVATGAGPVGQHCFASLDYVGSLSDAGSPIRVLSAMSTLLNKVGAVWRIGQVLSTVVDGIAKEESVAGSSV